MPRDVPEKAHDSGDMHQMEQVTELLHFQQTVEDILHHTDEDGEDSTEVVETVATNTTR